MTTAQIYYAVTGRRPPRRSPRRRSGRGPARNFKYRSWVRSLPCARCGSTYRVEAAHTGSDGGMSQKSSDYSVIPLCFDCHQAAPDSYHRDREAFEARLQSTIPGLVKQLNSLWFAYASEVK